MSIMTVNDAEQLVAQSQETSLSGSTVTANAKAEELAARMKMFKWDKLDLRRKHHAAKSYQEGDRG
jgi:hypothetical protein